MHRFPVSASNSSHRPATHHSCSDCEGRICAQQLVDFITQCICLAKLQGEVGLVCWWPVHPFIRPISPVDQVVATLVPFAPTFDAIRSVERRDGIPTRTRGAILVRLLVELQCLPARVPLRSALLHTATGQHAGTELKTAKSDGHGVWPTVHNGLRPPGRVGTTRTAPNTTSSEVPFVMHQVGVRIPAASDNELTNFECDQILSAKDAVVVRTRLQELR
mmetsp:Transcript_29087/g.73741  ORF Transcript_29087/g.73741 Transcript_29087/m.73741 type:complete len:219 (+) Transcript_29087:24-680(+)